MDSDDRWFFMPTAIADAAKPILTEAAEMIRRATGIDTEIRGRADPHDGRGAGSAA